MWCRRAHRHPDRNARQGAGRRQRRLHQRPQRDHRPAPPALAALSLLELRSAAHCRGVAQGTGSGRPVVRAAGTACSENTRYFRAQMTSAGFNVLPGEHPIVPVMFGDAVGRLAHGRSAARQRRLCRRVFVSRSCPRARPASAPRYRPRTRARRSNLRSRSSSRRSGSWASREGELALSPETASSDLQNLSILLQTALKAKEMAPVPSLRMSVLSRGKQLRLSDLDRVISGIVGPGEATRAGLVGSIRRIRGVGGSCTACIDACLATCFSGYVRRARVLD